MEKSPFPSDIKDVTIGLGNSAKVHDKDMASPMNPLYLTSSNGFCTSGPSVDSIDYVHIEHNHA